MTSSTGQLCPYHHCLKHLHDTGCSGEEVIDYTLPLETSSFSPSPASFPLLLHCRHPIRCLYEQRHCLTSSSPSRRATSTSRDDTADVDVDDVREMQTSFTSACATEHRLDTCGVSLDASRDSFPVTRETASESRGDSGGDLRDSHVVLDLIRDSRPAPAVKHQQQLTYISPECACVRATT